MLEYVMFLGELLGIAINAMMMALLESLPVILVVAALIIAASKPWAYKSMRAWLRALFDEE